MLYVVVVVHPQAEAAPALARDEDPRGGKRASYSQCSCQDLH